VVKSNIVPSSEYNLAKYLKVDLRIGAIAFLVLSVIFSSLAISGCGSSAGSTGSSTARPTPVPEPTLIIDIPQSALSIILDAPVVMKKDISYAIKVELAPKSAPVITEVAIEKAIATASQPVAVGTPGATLRGAFGPQFDVPSGEATLSSKTFDIEPAGTEKQPLDQSSVGWEWSVTPRSVGTQYLTVNIEATWVSLQGVARGPYRVGDRTFPIDVNDDFVSLGHFDVGAMLTSLPAALLAALLGGGGLVIWILRRRQGPQIVRRGQGKVGRRRRF